MQVGLWYLSAYLRKEIIHFNFKRQNDAWKIMFLNESIASALTLLSLMEHLFLTFS